MKHIRMTCHQHRCCRRPATAHAAGAATTIDYVLVAADASALEAVTTALRATGASPERHDLGLRLGCRGTNWRDALARTCAAVTAPSRRSTRVALIPLGADALTFQKALVTARPLEAFAATAAPSGACARADNPYLGDVFKGESLE